MTRVISAGVEMDSGRCASVQDCGNRKNTRRPSLSKYDRRQVASMAAASSA